MTTAKPNASKIRRLIVVSPAGIRVRTLRQLPSGVKPLQSYLGATFVL